MIYPLNSRVFLAVGAGTLQLKLAFPSTIESICVWTVPTICPLHEDSKYVGARPCLDCTLLV